MKILRLRLQNLNSLQGETEIDFTESPILDTGLFAITGDTGAGKTTVLDAITLALYGRIHRNKDVKEVMSYGQAECYAEIEFSNKNKIYRSKWSLWRARGKVDGAFQSANREIAAYHEAEGIFKLLSSRIKEVDMLVEQITGLDYNRFTRSVLLSQGDFAAFLNASEKDRSDLLERITGTEIYSKISIAAFQKHKEEQEVLNQLQVQQGALQLLSKEQVDDLKLDKKETETRAKTLQMTMDSFRKSIQWHTQIRQLDSEKAMLLEQQQEWNKHSILAKADLELLRQHEQTIPFQQFLTQLQDRQAEATALTMDIQATTAQIEALTVAEQTSKAVFKNNEKALQKLKKESQQLEKTWAAVQQLDIALAQKQEPLTQLEQNLAERQKEQALLEAELEAIATRLAKNQTEQKDLNAWLKEHQKLVKYTELAPQINLSREQLRTILLEQRKLEKELHLVEQEWKQKQATEAKAAKTLEQVEQREQDLLGKFKQIAPENFVLSRTELLQKLTEEIDVLDTETNQLQQLKVLSKEYMDLLTKYDADKDTLEHLQQEEVVLGMKILTNNELLEELAKRLAYKKGILDQQKLIANYERDRGELTDGEPCPLCFSTAHPFRDHQLTPFVDEAKKEHDAVEAQYDVMREDYVVLMTQYRDLIARIQHLKGDEDKDLEGQLDASLHLIHSMEAKIAVFHPHIKADLFGITKDGLFLEKINGFQAIVKSKKDARAELIALDKTLELKEKETETLNLQLQDAKYQVRSLTEKQERLLAAIATEKSDFDKHIQLLNQQLGQLGYAFEDIQSAGAMFVELEQKGKQYTQEFERASTLKQAIALLEQAQESKVDLLEKGKKDLAKQTKTHTALAAAVAKLSKERHDLFGTKIVETERVQQANLVQKTEMDLEASRQAMDKSIVSLKSHKAQLKEQERQVQKIQKNKTLVQTNLMAQLATSVFASLEALQAAILSSKQVDVFQGQRKKLEQKRIELDQAMRTNTAALAQLRETKVATVSLEEAQRKLPEAEEEAQQLQQQLGRIKEQLNQDKERKKTAKALLLDIEKQYTELLRWSNLNEIIGQADGQKFRKYAQGLTLQNLVLYANRHLTQLHGRYHISKPSDRDLHLEIVDTFQADNRRSMQTLSGGETFLISLALALALSDMAGSNTDIQSLFIDEGFGTLDQQTLDLAITTLENLQAQGKTIGVISHVKELKERIGTQIRIEKKGSGRSQVQVIG